jgi:hypothetical protein
MTSTESYERVRNGVLPVRAKLRLTHDDPAGTEVIVTDPSVEVDRGHERLVLTVRLSDSATPFGAPVRGYGPGGPAGAAVIKVVEEPPAKP